MSLYGYDEQDYKADPLSEFVECPVCFSEKDRGSDCVHCKQEKLAELAELAELEAA